MRPTNLLARTFLGGVSGLVLSIGSAQAEQPDLEALAQAVQQQSERLALQERLIAEQAALLEQQRIQLEALQRQVQQAGAAGRIDGTQPAEARTSAQAAQPAAVQQQAAQAGGPTRPPVSAQPGAELEAIDAITENSSVLTPQGSLFLEPSLEFNYSDSTRVLVEGYTVLPAISVGSIDIRDVQRTTWTGALSFRYGLTDRWEANARVPYVYRSDTTTGRNLTSGGSSTLDEVVQVDGDGIGDIEIGTRYQLTSGFGRLPLLIAGLNFKTATGKAPYEVDRDPTSNLELELPTGSGFYSLQPSLTAVVPSDPAVFFGTVSYASVFERDVTFNDGTEATIDPGDQLGFSIGMGFGINEQASFSLGYEHTYVFETDQEGVSSTGTDLHVGSLLFGFGYQLSDRASLNLQISTGVTDAAPDLRAIVRTPIRLF